MLHKDARVQELLKANHRDWNINLVQTPFWEDKARIILSMPLSSHGGPYKLIWSLSANGSFSMKSTYNVVLAIKKANAREVSNSANQIKPWKCIWSLTVPKKATNFLWRLSTNSTPTNSNMYKKKVDESGHCLLCIHE